MTIQELKSLEIEEKVEVAGGKGYIRRKSRDSFALVAHAVKSRCRFGTAKEILGDLEIFESTGYLPSGKQIFKKKF